MAIFHLTAKVISRGKGQSAIAAAAYRSGERLYDEQSAQQKYYPSRESRIVATDIMAPLFAPEWVFDREQLWNHVERGEKRKDAQLAREIEVALPHELTDEQRLWLVKDFAREQFVRKGYAVDFAIHAPDREADDRNYHAHLMITRRTIGPEGFAATKDWQFDKNQLDGWREQWAHLVNRHLERHGHEARVDHRSLEDQGIDREPTVHVGYAANEMTARGAQSDRMDILQQILARNEIRVDLRAIEAELKTLEQQQENEQRIAEAQRQKAAEAEHQALLAAWEARKRLHQVDQTLAPQSEAKPAQESERPAAEKVRAPEREPGQARPADQQAEPPVAEKAREPERDTERAKPTDRQAEPPVAAPVKEPARQAEKAQTDRPAEPTAKPTTKKAKTKAPQEWSYGINFVQPPQGMGPYAPLEHINARHAAAEEARRQAEAVQRSREAMAELARAAAADEAKLRAPKPNVASFERMVGDAVRQQANEIRAERREEKREADQTAWQKRLHEQEGRQMRGMVAGAGKAAGRQVAHSVYRVADRATGIVSSLGDFAATLLLGSPRDPPEQPNRIDMRRLATDPEARKQHQLAKHEEAKRRGLAMEVLEDIYRDMEAGRDLKPEDIAKLPREHLEQIVSKGDAYVRETVEASRRRADEYWRGRKPD